jgi:hypothetical protein
MLGMVGRKKKPETGRRGDTLRIRLTDAERAYLNEAANSRGLETSTWARMELLALARRIRSQK